MDTKRFLRTILGDEGFYCVTGIEELHGEKREPDVKQKFYTDLSDAIDSAQAFDTTGRNAYFALATFVESGSRRNTNVHQLRSFFLDLDCGANKDYDTQSAALTGLRAFCKELKLPKPTLVNSGRGIHVYWALAEPVSRETWVPVAERLKELCTEHGLRADPAVTSDSARVLRVPGTHNHKDTPPRLVEFIGEIAPAVEFETFRDLLGEGSFLRKKSFTPRGPDPVLDQMMGSFRSRFKTIMLKTIDGKGCNQLKWVYENQTTMPEPMWRAGLSIAAFCVDRDKAVHKISSKHPDYTPDSTERKADAIRGPYTCETFNGYNPGICGDCVNKGKFKSPITLGRELEVSEEPVEVEEKVLDLPSAPLQKFLIPKYPEPYRRGVNGGIFKVVRKDDEEIEVPVYHNDLYVVNRLRDPEIGEAVVMRLHLPKDGVRQFTVPLTAIYAKEEFRRHMAMQGVGVIKMDELMNYVSKWVNDLQMTTTAAEARRQFGWTDDNLSSFVLGGTEIFKDRVEVNPPSSSTLGLFPAFAPKGTLEGWAKTADFYNRPGFEVHQYMMGLSFGSVLIQYLPLNSSVFHLHSKDSGLGKSTAMYAGASVWGDPEILVMNERDTMNSKMNRMEVMKNLPCFFDEMTNTAPKDLSDFVYQIPSGFQRNRMSVKSNVERLRGMPWKNNCATNGNTDMLERISSYKALPKAEAQRVLSHRAPKIVFPTKSETDEFSSDIKDHYGHAGPIFVQYVMNNVDEVGELLKATQKRIDVAAGLKAENRYWSAQAASALTGLILANKLNLTQYDTAALFRWIIRTMQDANVEMETMAGDTESILSDYLAENYNNVLRIKSTQDLRKDINIPDAIPRGAMIGRYEYDVKKMYLIVKPLKAWCVKQQINYNAFTDSLRTGRMKAQKAKQRMGKGTHVNLPAADVWLLDFTDFMDDDKESSFVNSAPVLEKPTDE